MLRPCFIWRSHTYQHCDFLLGLLQLIYLHCSIWNSLLMQHSCPTLAFKPHFPLPPTWYLLTLHPHNRLMLLAVFLHFLLPLPPDSLRVLQWNAGGLLARSTELLQFIWSHAVDLICIQESNLIYLPLFESLDFLLCVLIAPTFRSGILSPDATHASGDVIISIRQGLSFSELFTFFLSSLDPYSDYVESTSLLTTLRFLSIMCMLSLFALVRRMAEPTPFSSSIFSYSRNLFILMDFNCYHPSATQKVLPTPVGRKYSIGSSPLISFFSMNLTYLLFSIASLAIGLFTSPLLSPLSHPCLFMGGASGLEL